MNHYFLEYFFWHTLRFCGIYRGSRFFAEDAKNTPHIIEQDPPPPHPHGYQVIQKSLYTVKREMLVAIIFGGFENITI